MSLKVLRAGVLRDAVRIAAIGIAAGAAGGYVLARVAESFFETVQRPGALSMIAAAALLIAAAIGACCCRPGAPHGSMPYKR